MIEVETVERMKPGQLLPLELRLWMHIDIRTEDECWPWQASTDRGGYGQIYDKPHDKRMVKKAHKLAFEFTKGSIPPGKLILHSCDSPPCCNPKHLRAGTKRDNSIDMYARGRHNAIMPCGEAHHMAVLTKTNVREIRSMYRTRNYTYVQLAAIFNVAKTTIGACIRADTWIRKSNRTLRGTPCFK